MKKFSILRKKLEPQYIKDVTFCCSFLLLFSFLSFAFTILLKIIGMHGNEMFGTASLLYCATTIIILLILDKRNKDIYPKIKPEKPTATSFLKLFSVMFFSMIIFTTPVILLDFILYFFGLTIQSIGRANEFSDSITDFIYVSFVGPITEELIFRWFVQKKLQKYSPVIAVITSAICFALFHANFGQIFPMIGTGLVLGYAAYKFSVKFSILMHITYNLVFGELFGMLTEILKNGNEEYVIPIINMSPFVLTVLFFSVIGCFVLFKYASKETNFFTKYNIKAKKLINLFKSPTFILFFTYAITFSIFFIKKIS